MLSSPSGQADPTHAGDGDMPSLLPIPDSDSESSNVPSLLAPSDSESKQYVLPHCEAEAKSKAGNAPHQPAASMSSSLFLSIDGNFRAQCRHMQPTKTTIISYDMHLMAHQVQETCFPDKATDQAEGEEGYGADMEGEEEAD
ncbi:hypothetical protein BOTBODRAFT_181362 [Botryobasidium botryosum FD-172 SS1]|uniref:Uncharacterized protein n=1 Tax=Botryobasidium botryosum (strain FD-172 SS1) TaxID=930990 RepID=A0A067M4Z3_BOTB1|nr:hypothetical protein BOTBODRAFT_181362 [Botryobasidium botryosum FD-172 SS1]